MPKRSWDHENGCHYRSVPRVDRAWALALAHDGLAIVVNYAGSADDATEVVREIESARGAAFAVQADVAPATDVARLFDQAGAAFRGIDVVVSSAGMITTGPIAEVDDGEFDRVTAVKLCGTFNVFREAARRLRDDGCLIGCRARRWLSMRRAMASTTQPRARSKA